MRIAYACSHWMGFPGLELIQSLGMLAGIAAPDTESDSVRLLRQLADRTRVPLLLVEKRGRRETLGVWLKEVGADVLFVVSFPWKIPDPVLTVPPLGCYNFHPGAVPGYRGIEPIFWTLRNGEAQTAVSVIRMDSGFDTGDVILSSTLPVHTDDTYGLLLNKLSVTARNAIETLLRKWRANEFPDGVSQPRDPIVLRHRPTIGDLTINWRAQTAAQIRNLVRAANPAFDGAVVNLRGFPFRLLAVSVAQQSPEPGVMPGTVLRVDPMTVACLDGALTIDVISSREGVFSGGMFAGCFGISRGELFSS